MGRTHEDRDPHPGPAPDGHSPDAVHRRTVLRGAGALGAGTLGAGALGAGALGAGALGAGALGAGARPAGAYAGEPADARGSSRRGGVRPRVDGYLWLAGDHHTHTQYSSDGLYRVADQVRHAAAYGLDWLVITDHGHEVHAGIGAAAQHSAIVAARREFPNLLVFQGLEWHVPAAEHGTVFVHPGHDEVAVLTQFETAYDAAIVTAQDATPENEALAVAGLGFLAEAVRRKRVADALFLANHPSQNGIDSPHEIRGWRDAQPRIAVGMEGAPGHQAAGIPAPDGPATARGLYDRWPQPASFPGYPAESYVTWGGFDWMTATVGGLWDSLLAEGRPWWITLGSDVHKVYADTAIHGEGPGFNATGHWADPAYAGRVRLGYGAFWPGFYGRTHVGASEFSYAAVMAGIRAGRIWVDHGGLIDALRVQVRPVGSHTGATLGGTLRVRPGTRVEMVITIDLPAAPNWAQFVPRLSRVDVIAGDVTGPASDRDAFTSPSTRVVHSFDVSTFEGSPGTGSITLTYPIGPVDRPRYFRLRGTDGNRSRPGLLGGDVDPAGPAADVNGDADPWTDLWFYANPSWVLPHR